jgi:hypothetical protein
LGPAEAILNLSYLCTCRGFWLPLQLMTGEHRCRSCGPLPYGVATETLLSADVFDVILFRANLLPQFDLTIGGLCSNVQQDLAGSHGGTCPTTSFAREIPYSFGPPTPACSPRRRSLEERTPTISDGHRALFAAVGGSDKAEVGRLWIQKLP